MLIKMARLLTILFTALSLGPALGHLLELPAKMTYVGSFWLQVSQTLYASFGSFGAAFEVAAVVTNVALALLVRHRHPAFAWTMLAALCMVATHAAFWIWLAPINASIAALTPETLPADWMALRQQWETTHAVRALLQLVAVGALAWSMLLETPNHIVRK